MFRIMTTHPGNELPMLQTQLEFSPSNRIVVKDGIYGDKHDPWQYTEVTVHGRAGGITLHMGIDTWCKHHRSNAKWRSDAALLFFEMLTGVSPQTAQRVGNRRRW